MATLTAFFEARRGRLYGFRFRDFVDFRSCAPGDTPSASDQPLGEGDGARTSFQLVKFYGDGEEGLKRRIVKLRIIGRSPNHLSTSSSFRTTRSSFPRSSITFTAT